jgi:IS5 family transposase
MPLRLQAHIGVDAESGLVTSVIGTAANINDVTQAEALLHGRENLVFADSGYQGADKTPETKPGVTWHISRPPSSRKPCENSGRLGRSIDKIKHLKANARAEAEHPFRVVKQRFGYAKVRYGGLAKNTARLTMLFALSNLDAKTPSVGNAEMSAPAAPEMASVRTQIEMIAREIGRQLSRTIPSRVARWELTAAIAMRGALQIP